MKRLNLTHQYPKTNWSVKSIDGDVLTDKERINEQWEEFYKNLYFSERGNFIPFEETETIPQTTLKEVQIALNNLKPKKATGPDNLSSDMLKESGTKLHLWLTFLVNTIFQSRIIPTQLETSEIITLYKKSNPMDCANYRPISLP